MGETQNIQSCSLLKNLSAQFLMQKNVERERERERVTVAWHWQVHVMQHGYPLEMKVTRLPDPPLLGEVLESMQPRQNHQVYNTLFKQSLSQLPKLHFFSHTKTTIFYYDIIYIYLVVWWSGWLIEAPGNHKRHQVRRDRLNQKFH